MAILLLIASPTYVLLGDYGSAAVTAVALLPVTAVGIILEHRAETALQRLREMTAPTARVIRDGLQIEIPAAFVVPGDLVGVNEGDVVPADGQLVAGIYIAVNEAPLTGESLPITKAANGSGSQRELYAGTYVVSGQGLLSVSETGPATRLGQVARLVSGVRPSPTPLQAMVRRLITRLGVVAGLICFLVVLVQLAYGEGVGSALIAGVSLAIASVPEEFPIVFTLYLGLGAWRLARENALVRRLVGVEVLGSTTVICADKTGTLTLGELSVVEAIAVADESGNEAGEERLLRAAVLACESQPTDPLDVALHRYARDHGVAVDTQTLARDYPFDPRKKYLTHVWRTKDGHYVAAKGAVEGILDASRIGRARRERANALNDSLAGQGQRVIAVAGGLLDRQPSERPRDESALEFLGLIGFADPVRPGVAAALEECRNAGIRVVMITGDHPVTAVAVGESLGLARDRTLRVRTGDELDAMDDSELARAASEVEIFARTRPEQKFRLVQALKATGEVVAMTGDGINDAPALKEADIGVAMGKRGTAVAREAATLVLLDDNFSTIVIAVREGRRIFENLRRAFVYLIGFHIPILLSALLVPLANEPLLLLPVNLVLLEILLHPIVSLVFDNDPPDPDLMKRPPRPRTQGLLRARDAMAPLSIGTALATSVLVLYLLRLRSDAPVEEARSMAIATLIFGQLLMLLAVRTREEPLWQAQYAANPVLGPIIAATVALTVLLVSVPGLNDLMHLAPMPWSSWTIAVLLATVSTLWLEPAKMIARRRRTHASANRRSSV